MSPSLKNMPVSVPPTCARISTSETAENWPRKLRRVSRFCISGLLTTTLGMETAAAFGGFALACGGYLSQAATSAVTAKTAPIHTAAGTRRLDRGGSFSASRSDSSFSPETIPVALPDHCAFHKHSYSPNVAGSTPSIVRQHEALPGQ